MATRNKKLDPRNKNDPPGNEKKHFGEPGAPSPTLFSDLGAAPEASKTWFSFASAEKQRIDGQRSLQESYLG